MLRTLVFVFAVLCSATAALAAPSFYTQARLGVGSIGAVKNGDDRQSFYPYMGFGVAASVWGRPDQDKLSVTMSAALLDMYPTAQGYSAGKGLRGAAELQYSPFLDYVWFSLAAGCNALPESIMLEYDWEEYLVYKHQVPATWVADLTAGLTAELPLRVLTEDLSWLGLYASGNFGVGTGPYTTLTGWRVMSAVAGLRISN